METSHIISFITGLVLSVVFIYFRYYHGFKGALRKFVLKNNLSTASKGQYVAAEWLRQQFLAETPKFRSVTTEEFIYNMKRLIHYQHPSNDFEDGAFFIHTCSPLLIAPPPTKDKPYVPPGWEDFQ